MLTVSELYIYPIKSLGGIAVQSAPVTSRGFLYDRRMMLTDLNNRFLTQREHPQMALLQPVFADGGFIIQHKKGGVEPLFVPLLPSGDTPATVTIWNDTCEAQVYDDAINNWFSRALELDCRLVYMPDRSHRYVDKRYAHHNEITTFSDEYPMLVIGQSSLDDLNSRLEHPLPMNRFRPNIVFTGGTPFVEDEWQQFSINGIVLKGVKPCARCVMTTIDQETIARAKEPLKTLAGYRQKENKILFGQNLLHEGEGFIHIGDNISVSSYQPAAIG